MTQTMIMTREFPHRQDRLWRAISTGALLEDWLMPNDFQPVPGHRFTFRAGEKPGWDGVIQSQVLEVEPPSHLSFTWVALGVDTVVSLRLEPVANGTRLTVEQSGFTEDQTQNLAGARYGWTHFLHRLSERLETT
jgi:uncharacterized protein YndB with AHSA1/START domain